MSDHPPSAVERNAAAASKSYVVSEPSTALLDSLRTSQRSAASTMLDISQDLRSTLTPEREAVQPASNANQTSRKLDYFSLESLKVFGAGDSPELKSSDVPKEAHIQRYLQQLGIAEKPVPVSSTKQTTREAWAESASTTSQSKSHSKSGSLSRQNISVPGLQLQGTG